MTSNILLLTAVFPGVEQAGLSEYARHILKEICSQSWLREKFLKDPEALLTSDLLLDNGLSHKQVSDGRNRSIESTQV